jgi:hypothetical protein
MIAAGQANAKKAAAAGSEKRTAPHSVAARAAARHPSNVSNTKKPLEGRLEGRRERVRASGGENDRAHVSRSKHACARNVDAHSADARDSNPRVQATIAAHVASRVAAWKRERGIVETTRKRVSRAIGAVSHERRVVLSSMRFDEVRATEPSSGENEK